MVPMKGMNFEEQVGDAADLLFYGWLIGEDHMPRVGGRIQKVFQSASALRAILGRNPQQWFVRALGGILQWYTEPRRRGGGFYSRLTCHLLPYKNQKD